jgi:lipopolysaccharide transport system ATP-binding protein
MIVIRVENLTKEYRLGTINHGTLAQDLQSWWARLRGKEDPNSLITLHHHSTLNPQPSTVKAQPSTLNSQPPLNPHFLALNDVSFEVKQGEAVGIIGRNGAGKSTLLKILSRVTAPTSGEVKIKGRVASLLEVGTGFHPELTGRENIFLNGAILGMSRAEIARKFDEIVAFAEVEQFIDTPVKRYSSGMYVRLAFAVAAHLEPEILIVDEVLAVGDAQFQKKCLGKMGEVGKEGKTVLFVSHNMNVITRLCGRAILFASGKIVCQGPSDEIVPFYLNSGLGEDKSEAFFQDDPDKPFQVIALSLRDKCGNLIQRQVEVDEPITINVVYKISRSLPGGYAGFTFRNAAGDIIFMSDSRDSDMSCCDFEKSGLRSFSITFPAPLLVPGRYTVTAAICQQGKGALDACLDAVALEVVNIRSIRTSWAGYVHFPLQWQEVSC